MRNLFNPRQVSRVRLNDKTVDGVVFWTKNPRPMLDRHADELLRLPVPSYFQFTVTPHGKELEPGVPDKDGVMASFAALSRLLGPGRVVWRYDPIVLSTQMNLSWHTEQFSRLAETLAPYTDMCVISFLDFYRKMSRRMAGTMDIREATEDEMRRLAAALAPIAADHGLRLMTCSEAVDLSDYGIGHGSCIDPKRLEMLASKGGAKMRCKVPRDRSQRVDCDCVSSINIGAYDTCGHGCAYCYANGTQAQVARHLAAYRPDSALLCDELRPDDRVTERSMPRFLGFP